MFERMGLCFFYNSRRCSFLSRHSSHCRSKIGCSVIGPKGVVIRSRCLLDFHQTEIKVVLDPQSTNTNFVESPMLFRLRMDSVTRLHLICLSSSLVNALHDA